MRFLGYFRSSSAYRCRIAFNLKGVEVDAEPVSLLKDGGEQKKPDYLSLNPQGLVPALVTDDGDVLYQSLAIVEWLDETIPDPPLLPTEPLLRAQVRAFSQIMACDIHPLHNLRVIQYLRDGFEQDQDGVNAWCSRWIFDGLAACEEILSRQTHGGDFCFGNSPGLADLCLVPQVFAANRFGTDISGMTNVLRIHETCEALEAFADAHPTRQPDFQP